MDLLVPYTCLRNTCIMSPLPNSCGLGFIPDLRLKRTAISDRQTGSTYGDGEANTGHGADGGGTDGDGGENKGDGADRGTDGDGRERAGGGEGRREEDDDGEGKTAEEGDDGREGN
eukprot:5139860-Pleurochrysis_carterae.AAC.1